jgi:membrane fusion protein, multidrug efflux system
MQKNYFNTITVLVCLFSLLSACQKPVEPAPPPRPALVTMVGKTASAQGMVLVGEVKSRYESAQSFRIGGKIIERKVDVGAMVKKGQLIARLDAADANLNTSAAIADVRVAEADRSLAYSEVARQRKLVDKQFISRSALDKYEAALKTADARVNAAKAQAAVSGNQSRYANLVADMNGVVTQIHAEPGQVVTASEMVVQIVDTKQIEVLVAVPESRMNVIKLKDTVLIRLWADRETAYTGRVREIAPAANSATRAFDVRVAIDKPDEKVRLGMTAGVRFGADAATELVIPSTALTQINGKNMVWVISKDGIANPRDVQAGQFSEQGVLISSGLQMGEMVAIAGVHTLIKGQKVKPQVVLSP